MSSSDRPLTKQLQCISREGCNTPVTCEEAGCCQRFNRQEAPVSSNLRLSGERLAACIKHFEGWNRGHGSFVADTILALKELSNRRAFEPGSAHETKTERMCRGCEHKIPWDWVFCAWCGEENDRVKPSAVKTGVSEVERLRSALAMMYDKWEDGVTCWEDGDDSGISLGNAFKLTGDEEREVLSLIPSQRSVEETSAPRCHFMAFRKPEFQCTKPAGHDGPHSCGLAPTIEPTEKVSPDEECTNCGRRKSHHLVYNLVCPDAALGEVYRFQPTSEGRKRMIGILQQVPRSPEKASRELREAGDDALPLRRPSTDELEQILKSPETPEQHRARNRATGCDCNSDTDEHLIWCSIGTPSENGSGN